MTPGANYGLSERSDSSTRSTWDTRSESGDDCSSRGSLSFIYFKGVLGDRIETITTAHARFGATVSDFLLSPTEDEIIMCSDQSQSGLTRTVSINDLR